MSNIIVMAFLPRNIVGCLLKRKAYKGGSWAPQDPPSLHPCINIYKKGKKSPSSKNGYVWICLLHAVGSINKLMSQNVL